MAYPILQNMKVGWQIGSIGFNFIQNHLTTLLFSVLSGCLFTVTALFFIVPFIASSVMHQSISHHWILGFIFLFLTTLFSTLMKVSLTIYTDALFENNPIGFFTSISKASSRMLSIAQWAFIDAVLGTIVKLLRVKNRNTGLLVSFLRNLVGTVLQLGWNVFTYFVIPLLAFEQLPLLETMQESANILKKTWGPSAGAHFNIGVIQTLLLLLCYLFLFGPFIVYCTYFLQEPLAIEKALSLGIFGILAFFIPLLVITVIISTIKTVVKTALYNYTKNKPTGPFETALLKMSFSSNA